ncbi:phosphonate ABC transporter, permease protein PhnE [Nakamurella antarctica]|uniref:Phosphonate ABC transporter, permease protein PhnE n=1 Tax=Nakamurella antarctica TaxID=1902245 RepID=A0A3G8ZXG8_9ACTN|nr:phosphonate ABC transporter, permease protein PhnE [Nakamurella antarctica]AZI58716.1 phosphonate ABC transporter, permease protein PhnE [Nakamurella antarctica]
MAVKELRPPLAGKPRLSLGRILTIIAVVSVVVWAFAGIGWVRIGSSWSLVLGAIVRGFLHPDWGYVEDGTSEDLLSLLLLTLAIAFCGTVIAVLGAAPLAFLAATRPGRRRAPVPVATGIFFTIVRTFPEIVLAVIFVKMVGPGPFAGALAIGVHTIGMLGRLYAEEIEKLDVGPDQSMVAVGATRAQILIYSQLPRLIPQFLSLALNRFEIAVRSAAILGIVGAGGIGTPIIFAVASRSWDRVGIILIGVVIMVSLIDWISGMLRRRLR